MRLILSQAFILEILEMTTIATDNGAFVIVFYDSDNNYYTYAIPKLSEIPPVIFKSYEEAKTALMRAVTKFESFHAVAYGKAYPYENTSFENELNTKGFALLGWVGILEDGERLRIPLGLARLSYSG